MMRLFDVVDVLQAVMVGNYLPNDLDLIDLAQTDANRIYVIVDSGHDQGQGQGQAQGTISPATKTKQPSSAELGSVTFTSGRSYLRRPQWTPGRRGRIEFKFKTIQRNGVMMVTSPSPGRSDFFAVEISDGDLYALFNLGGETQRFLVAAGVNDAQPHHVIMQRTGRRVTFTADRKPRSYTMSVSDDDSLDLGSTFFVGGTSNPEQLPWLLYSRLHDFYRGCLWDLRFDGDDIIELDQLRQDQGMTGMRRGSASMPSDCTDASCLHGGICREGWNGHTCYCMLTAYTGKQCETGQLSTTRTISSTLSWSLLF